MIPPSNFYVHPLRGGTEGAAMPIWNAHHAEMQQGGYNVGAPSAPHHGVSGGGPQSVWSGATPAQSVWSGVTGGGASAAAALPWVQQSFQPPQHGHMYTPQHAQAQQPHYSHNVVAPPGVYHPGAPQGGYDGYGAGLPQGSYDGRAQQAGCIVGAPEAHGYPWGQGSAPHQADSQVAMPNPDFFQNLTDPGTEKERKRRQQQEMQRALQAQMEENAQRKRDQERMKKLQEEQEEERMRRDTGISVLPGPHAAKNRTASAPSDNAAHGAAHAMLDQPKHGAPGRQQFVDADAHQGRPPRPPPYPTASTPIAHAADSEDPQVVQRRRKQEQMEAMQRDLQKQIDEKKAHKEREQRLLREEEERQEERIRREMEIQAQREAAENEKKQQKMGKTRDGFRDAEMGKTRERLRERDPEMGKTRDRLRDPEMGKTRDRLRERDPEMGKTRDSLRQTGMGKTRDRLRESDMGRSRKGKWPRTRGSEAAFSEPPVRRTRQGGESPDAFRGLQDGNDMSLGMRAFNERQQALVQEMHQQLQGLRQQRDKVTQQATRYRETELDRRAAELDELQQQLVQQLRHGTGAGSSSSSSSTVNNGASRRSGSQPPPRLFENDANESSVWEKSLVCDTKLVPLNELPLWLDTQREKPGSTADKHKEKLGSTVAKSLVDKSLIGSSHFSAMGALQASPRTQGAVRNSQSVGLPILLSGSSHLVPGEDNAPVAGAGASSAQPGTVGSFQFSSMMSSGVGKTSLERAESDDWKCAERCADDSSNGQLNSWKALEEPLRKLEEAEKEMFQVFDGVIQENEREVMPKVSSQADKALQSPRVAPDSDTRPLSALPEQQVETFKSALQMADGLPLELRDDLCKLLEENLMPSGNVNLDAPKTTASELPSLSISKSSTATEDFKRTKSGSTSTPAPRPPRSGRSGGSRPCSGGSRKGSPLNQIGSSADIRENRGRAEFAESRGPRRVRSRSNCLDESDIAALSQDIAALSQDEPNSWAGYEAETFPTPGSARRRRISEERRAQSAKAAVVRRAEDEMIESMKSVPSPRLKDDDALSQLLSSHSRPFSAPE